MKNHLLTAAADKRGFTLVEIIIALLIIFILVMAVAPLYEFVAQAMNSNKYKQTATGLANSVLEEMRALPYVVKDPDTGMLVTDIDVPQLGLQGGNPPGSIPATQTRTIDGRTYTIKTRVYWVAKDDNPAAYKKVKVAVECASAFKGDVTVSSDFYTLASQEGEAEVFAAGHIKVHIRNKDGEDWDCPEMQIKVASGTFEETGYTEDGTALFGIIPAGSYTVSAQLPSNLVTRPDVVLNSGWIEKSNITVTNLTTTDVYFDIESPARFRLALTDQNTSEAIVGTGSLGLTWSDGSGNVKVIDPVPFTSENFANQKLNSGKLWPAGFYSISLTDVLDTTTYKAYYAYNMADDDKPVYNGSAWDGKPGAAGSNIDLSLALESALKIHLTADAASIAAAEDGTWQWTDQSGNSYYAVQYSGSNLSTFSGGTALDFTGTDILQIDYPVCYDNFTILVKAKPSVIHEIDSQSASGYGGVTGQNYLLWPNHGGDFNAGAGISLGTNGFSNYEHGSDYMPATAVYAAYISPADFSIIGLRYIAKQPSLYLDGSEVTLGETSPREHVYSPTDIGGGAYGNFTGSVAEIMIYDYPLNDDQLELISDHLAGE